MLTEHVRQQIDIIERALAKTGKSQRAVPLTYIAWGLVGTIFNLAYVPWPWIAAHQPGLFVAGDIMTIATVLITGFEYWQATIDRRTTMDVQSLAIFGLVTNLLWILKIPLFASGAVGGLAYAYIYSIGIAIALIVHGAGPMRPLMYGGFVLLGAVLFGALHPSDTCLSLAIGNYAALVIPGVYLAFAPPVSARG